MSRQRVPKGTPAKRVVRLYEQDRTVFRKGVRLATFLRADIGPGPPVNEIPKTASRRMSGWCAPEHRPNITLKRAARGEVVNCFLCLCCDCVPGYDDLHLAPLQPGRTGTWTHSRC